MRGVDCVGLLVLTARDLGYPVTDVPSYPRLPEGERLRTVLEAQLVRVNRLPLAGDIGLFHERRYPFHVCVFAERYGQLSMIHAFAKRRKVVEEVYAHDWPAKLMAVYALPGIFPCS